MSNEELLEEVKKVDSPLNQLGRKVRATNQNLFDEIMSRTSFLEDPNIQFTARLHCLERGLVEQPTCKMCSNPVEWYGKTNNFRTYCSRKCKNEDKGFWDKVQGTCEERLGVRNAFQSEVVKQKIREKNKENLGVDYPMQSRIVREKSIMSCRKNMGVDNPSQSEEVKCKKSETTFAHFGVECSFQSPIVRDKPITTCLEKFGVDNFSKSPLFTTFHRKRIFHDNIWFDSGWEVLVYDFLKSNNIAFEYSPSISLSYEYDGRTWTYHPDFLINGKLYEVKGDHFFRIDESGREVMFNPYRKPEWSDERYAWECGKYEAKHQCMLSNNIAILRESDVRNLTSLTFGVDV